MVKVSPDQSAANRQALLDAAGRLFRQKGIDAVGVAELCAAAGLTHGALYSHFGSKDALAAEAFIHGYDEGRARRAKILGDGPDAKAVIDDYVSIRHRDSVSACCPMLASASEAARQSQALKVQFAQAFSDLSGRLRSPAQQPGSSDPDPHLAVIAASMIGVVSVARALKAADPALSDQLIDSARIIFGDLIAQADKQKKSSTRKR
jgi:TetR/AcrR family transcriptional repressor of nem operon